jgi:LTXXQ motif family protein
MMNLARRSLLSVVMLATLPAGIAFAQAPGLRERPSADTIARLQDGRIAMAKAALRLSDTQAKLWTPLEEQIRASLAERAKARQDREQAWREGAPRQDLAERLEQASQRMTQRAEHMKAFTAAFKNLYATLSDEQKPLARLVLRAMGRGHHHGRFAAGWDERSPGEHRREQR